MTDDNGDWLFGIPTQGAFTYDPDGTGTTDVSIHSLIDTVTKMKAKLEEQLRQQGALAEKLEELRFDPKFWAWVDTLERRAFDDPSKIFGVQLPKRPEGM